LRTIECTGATGAELKEEKMPTTMVRTQMAASAGALAAERERLEREIEALSKGLSPEAAEIVRAADALMSQHADRLTALKAARDRIDQAFGVKQHEVREAAAAAAEAEEARLRQALLDAEGRRLAACARAEASWRAAVADTRALIEANAATYTAILAMRPDRGLVRGSSMGELERSHLMRRLSGRVASLLRTLLPVGSHRFGDIDLPNSSLHPVDQPWAEREAALAGPIVAALTGAQG
jgi:hypothetical protein